MRGPRPALSFAQPWFQDKWTLQPLWFPKLLCSGLETSAALLIDSINDAEARHALQPCL